MLQRQPANISPPPVIFPTPYEWLGTPSLQDAIVEAWNDPQLDDTDRGYVVMWNEKSREFWTVDPYDAWKAAHYFHGPIRRPQMLPPGPLFP